jgi:cytochrome b561
MTTINPQKYDRPTRLLHAALAIGVVLQLSLSTVMTVPAGRGLGVRDWHRSAFEIHAEVGIFVVAICALHWLWVCLPRSHPGCSYLFPWWWRAGRTTIHQELGAITHWHIPSPKNVSALVGTVHGLGLAAVTGSSICGLINYFGYFLGAPIPPLALHWVGLSHIAFGYLIWAFVMGHVGMALGHWCAGTLAGIGQSQPR